MTHRKKLSKNNFSGDSYRRGCSPNSPKARFAWGANPMSIGYYCLIVLSVLIVMCTCRSVSSAEVPVESLIPKEDIPQGWALIQGPQVYTEKTLFEHINGQAELFFKYGFQKSAFAIYQNRRNQKYQIEVDIYDMGNVLHAFGVFSRFRNQDRPVGIGLDSYLDNHSLTLYKGKYFVMLYATESDSSVLKEWAMTISLKILDPSLSPKEIGYFPKEGLKPGSIQYYPEGLLGYKFLGRGFQGTYLHKVKAEDEGKEKVEVKGKVKAEAEGKEYQLFLAVFENSQEAMGALEKYRKELSKKGKVHSGIPAPFGSNALKGEDPYRGKVIGVPKGFYLLGAVGLGRERDAENLLVEFVKRVK